MTTPQIIRTAFEIVMIAILILGFVYEPALAKWEEKQKEKVLRAFKERRKYRK